MESPPDKGRRGGRRLKAALRVRFSVNGGEEQTSDTINFTSRGMAIRSNCPVRKGDRIVAKVDELPEIEGEVVRVFDEGFAIRLNDMSLALVAYANAEIPDVLDDGPSAKDNTRRIFSPIFKAVAPAPSWGRIATTRTKRGGSQRHFLSIITTHEFDLDSIRSVWVSVDEARWAARVLQARRRGDQSIIVILLNQWQLHMAASDAMTVSVLSAQLSEWSANLDARFFSAHLDALQPKKTALSA